MRGGCLVSQPAILTYIFILCVCVSVSLYEEEVSLSCLLCCCVCRRLYLYSWVCMNARMHVIVCACYWLCTTLSFYMGMCLSLCSEVHKYILETVWVFACVFVCTGDESV